MLSNIRRLARPIHWIEDTLLHVTVLMIIGVSIGQILLRNFSDSGMVWAEPALRISVLWVAMLGAMRASRINGHISIDLLQRYYSGPARKYISSAAMIAAAMICATATYYSVEFVLLEREDGSSAFADVPAWVCEAIIPIALGSMSARFLFQALLSVLGQEE